MPAMSARPKSSGIYARLRRSSRCEEISTTASGHRDCGNGGSGNRTGADLRAARHSSTGSRSRRGWVSDCGERPLAPSFARRTRRRDVFEPWQCRPPPVSIAGNGGASRSAAGALESGVHPFDPSALEPALPPKGQREERFTARFLASTGSRISVNGPNLSVPENQPGSFAERNALSEVNRFSVAPSLLTLALAWCTRKR